MSSDDSRYPGTSRQLGGTNVTREEFDRLFSAISDVKGQISSMKRDLTKERDEANDQLVKRLKLEKKTVFKRKGNERQHGFNAEVQEKLVSASGALEDAPPDIEKAKKILKEGEEIIKERQKLIRVADRSEHGWATVDEYVADELADDSDDEKRLFKAEARAGRKLQASKTKGKKAKARFPFPDKDLNRPSAQVATAPVNQQSGTAGNF